MPDDVPKVVYVIRVKNSRPSTNTMSMANDIPSSDPKFQHIVESPTADLQTVNNGVHGENSLIVHPHSSKFKVARDFMEAHSDIESKVV